MVPSLVGEKWVSCSDSKHIVCTLFFNTWKHKKTDSKRNWGGGGGGLFSSVWFPPSYRAQFLSWSILQLLLGFLNGFPSAHCFPSSVISSLCSTLEVRTKHFECFLLLVHLIILISLTLLQHCAASSAWYLSKMLRTLKFRHDSSLFTNSIFLHVEPFLQLCSKLRMNWLHMSKLSQQNLTKSFSSVSSAVNRYLNLPQLLNISDRFGVHKSTKPVLSEEFIVPDLFGSSNQTWGGGGGGGNYIHQCRMLGAEGGWGGGGDGGSDHLICQHSSHSLAHRQVS